MITQIESNLEEIRMSNAQLNKNKKRNKIQLNIARNKDSSVKQTLQKLTEPVLRKNPIAQWDKDKYECIRTKHTLPVPKR